MTKRENIIRAAACDNPEYIPCDIPCNTDWLIDKNTEKIKQINDMKIPFGHFVGGVLKTESKENTQPKHDDPSCWYDTWMTEWEDDGNGDKVVEYNISRINQQIETGADGLYFRMIGVCSEVC